MFSNELLLLIAKICDCRSISSTQDKMKLTQQLLVSYGVKFEVLGGATNRLTLLIDTYAIKFAMDNEGYRDNFMEYSLSPELQPYVTKAYETNGYVLVAECVKTLSIEEFNIHRPDVRRVLQTLGNEYLLGDVGIQKRNFTNWGIRDNGEIVILDYAYMHRADEKLFVCEWCGDGYLSYDETFTKLICSNKTGGCGRTHTYDDRKRVQGSQVDIDMINEAKDIAIIIKGDDTEKEINNSNYGTLVDNDVRIIETASDVDSIWEEVYNKMIISNNNDIQSFDALVKKCSGFIEDEPLMVQGIPSNVIPRMTVSPNCSVQVEFDDDGMPHVITDDVDSVDDKVTQNDDGKPTLTLDDLINMAAVIKDGAMLPSVKQYQEDSHTNDGVTLDDLIKRASKTHNNDRG